MYIYTVYFYLPLNWVNKSIPFVDEGFQMGPVGGIDIGGPPTQNLVQGGGCNWRKIP